MSKRTGRGQRRRVHPARSLKAAGNTPSRLLDRILETPHLAQVVPQLQPDVLHRVIQHCGLEDCGELVAFATPEQLARVFDLDLWHTNRPGLDEQFDADRFGVWLEVMVESGVSVAAATLAAMDADLAIVALARHVLVFDYAAVAPYVSLDGEVVLTPLASDDRLRCEVGGYVVVARQTESWDAIEAVLIELETSHPGYFGQVMDGCRRLSNSRPEVDGLDDLMTVGDQVVFDLASGREQRRGSQGYVTPAEARSFLQMARRTDLRQGTTCPLSPVAQAHFRVIDEQTAVDPNSAVSDTAVPGAVQETPGASLRAVAEVVDLLHEAGVLPRNARALLESPGEQEQAPRLSRIRTRMQFLQDHDPDAYSSRSEELAFLANALIAGASIQTRPFTPEEASNAALALCNLGLENWPAHWLAAESRERGLAGSSLPVDLLVRHDLVGVFQVGLTVLHDNVCMHAAEHLIAVLTSLQCRDRETHASLSALRVIMAKHWKAGAPWNARDALDVIAILDMPAWAALLGLIDELPVLHAAVDASLNRETREVSASAFEFISENSQISRVHEFMQSLPEMLRS